MTNFPVVTDDCVYRYYAEIPEKPKPRRATHRELSMWLAQGKGEVTDKYAGAGISTTFTYYDRTANEPETVRRVRKWGDTEWHEPTVDYMFGEDAV